MRILQVNTMDVGGGAALVAWTLFTTYRERGYTSWLAVGQKHSDDPDVLVIPDGELRGRWAQWWWSVHTRFGRTHTRGSVARAMRVLVRGVARTLAEPARALDYYRGAEDFRFPGTRRLMTLTREPPSLIHTHNLHGEYFDLRELPRLSRRVPLVVTLHDAWMLSGHCAHSLSCERWQTGCGQCPDLEIPPAVRRDATAFNWRRKRDLYAGSRLYVATPSTWLMRKVERSMLAPAIVDARVIPNGVDLSVFQPVEKHVARAELAIPQEDYVVVFAAHSLGQNIWKDQNLVRDAVVRAAECVGNERRLVLTALGDDGPTEQIGRALLRRVGYVRDRTTVARYFQAADAYVHAARADTFPNTVLEAAACGTPVVATAVGGIPEQIDPGVTGFLVTPGDVQAMALCLIQILTNDDVRQRVSRRAAEATRRRFDLQRQADTYLDWYANLTEASLRGDM